MFADAPCKGWVDFNSGTLRARVVYAIKLFRKTPKRSKCPGRIIIWCMATLACNAKTYTRTAAMRSAKIQTLKDILQRHVDADAATAAPEGDEVGGSRTHAS